MGPNRYFRKLLVLLVVGTAWLTCASAGRADFWETMVQRSQLRPEAPPPALEVSERSRAGPAGAEVHAEPLDPPQISRIVIEPGGLSRLEGRGTPGSQVEIRSSDHRIATVTVEASGKWTAALERALTSGDHDLASSATGAAGVTYGDEVRLALPESHSEITIVDYDKPNETGSLSDDSQRKRAEDLARAASERFTEIEAGNKQWPEKPVRTSQAAPPTKPATVSPKTSPALPDVVTPVYDWLERSAREYQGNVIERLSVPKDGTIVTAVPPSYDAATRGAAAAIPAGPVPAPEGGATGAELAISAVRRWLDGAGQVYQREVAGRLSVPREAPVDSSPTASGTPPPGIAPKAEQVPVIAGPSQRKDDAEKRRIQELAERKTEAKRRADAEAEAFMSERSRIAEQLRQRRARATEEVSRSAEAKRLAEETARRAAADAEIKAREEKRKAEIERLRQEEASRLSEAQRLLAERNTRKAAEAAAKKAEEAKRIEEKRALAAKKAEESRQAEAERLEEARLMREAEERRNAEDKEREAAAALARRASKAASETARREEPPRKMPVVRETQTEAAAKAEEEVRGRAAPGAILDDEDAISGDEEDVTPSDITTGPSSDSEDGSGVEIARSRFSVRPAAKRQLSARGKSAHAGPRTKAWRKRAAASRVAAGSCRKRIKAGCRGGGIYVVRPGDTLWAIANRNYCVGHRYETIYRANRRKIADPDRIFPNMRLILPRKGC